MVFASGEELGDVWRLFASLELGWAVGGFVLWVDFLQVLAAIIGSFLQVYYGGGRGGSTVALAAGDCVARSKIGPVSASEHPRRVKTVSGLAKGYPRSPPAVPYQGLTRDCSFLGAAVWGFLVL